MLVAEFVEFQFPSTTIIGGEGKSGTSPLEFILGAAMTKQLLQAQSTP